MVRRLISFAVVAGLLGFCVFAYSKAQSSAADSEPEWAADAGPVPASVTTPLFSARRAPEWLTEDLIVQRLANAIEDVASVASAPDQTCVVVYRNSEAVTSIRGDEAMAPASLMKIVTASAILEQAGPDATYTTKVFITSEARDTIADGVLDGDLYLVGGGDPVLSTPGYVNRYDEPRTHTDITVLAERVAAELTRLGVDTITGGVVADESRYPEEERDYTEEIPWGSVSNAEASTTDDAASETEGETAQASADTEDVETPLPIWKPSFVLNNLAGPLSALLLDDGYASYPDEPNRLANVRAADPARQAVELFDDLLEERDFVIRSRTSKGTAPQVPAQRAMLGQVESPPLREIVAHMLIRSDNTTAEMLLKEIGLRSSLSSARMMAVFGVYGILQDLGLSVEEIVLSDGSGLSGYNRVTCELIAGLLQKSGPDSPLSEGLAVVGESGTLRECLTDDPAVKGRVRAKTGTLQDVTAVAGFTETDTGEAITFTVISNGPDVGALGLCNEIQQAIITATTGYPYGPEIDDLIPLPASTRPAATVPSN